MASSSRRQHTETHLEKKISLILASQETPKPTQQQLSERFGIGRSTVCDILKKRKQYMEAWESNCSTKRRRVMKETPFNSLNELMYSFFSQARAKNIPISGGIIQSKALWFAERLHFNDFQASNGWLASWKHRYNIKQFKISGESADVDVNVVNQFKERLPDLISTYSPNLFFTCDETGLFYHALPNKTLAQVRDNVHGCKLSKDRLTVLWHVVQLEKRLHLCYR